MNQEQVSRRPLGQSDVNSFITAGLRWPLVKNARRFSIWSACFRGCMHILLICRCICVHVLTVRYMVPPVGASEERKCLVTYGDCGSFDSCEKFFFFFVLNTFNSPLGLNIVDNKDGVLQGF